MISFSSIHCIFRRILSIDDWRVNLKLRKSNMEIKMKGNINSKAMVMARRGAVRKELKVRNS